MGKGKMVKFPVAYRFATALLATLLTVPLYRPAVPRKSFLKTFGGL